MMIPAQLDIVLFLALKALGDWVVCYLFTPRIVPFYAFRVTLSVFTVTEVA